MPTRPHTLLFTVHASPCHARARELDTMPTAAVPSPRVALAGCAHKASAVLADKRQELQQRYGCAQGPRSSAGALFTAALLDGWQKDAPCGVLTVASDPPRASQAGAAPACRAPAAGAACSPRLKRAAAAGLHVVSEPCGPAHVHSRHALRGVATSSIEGIPHSG